MSKREVWRETDGVERRRLVEAAERAKRERIVSGLARCCVCGGTARVQEFGEFGRGIWVGCDNTRECIRNLSFHQEGWSLEEAAAEWNFYNRGFMRIVRKGKMWVEKRFGRLARAERWQRREQKAVERARRERLREVFGGQRQENHGIMSKIRLFWGKVCRKSDK